MIISIKECNYQNFTNLLKQIFQIQIPVTLSIVWNAAFTASKFKKFLWNYNVTHIMTKSHHPEDNVKVVHLNQTTVSQLRCVTIMITLPYTFFGLVFHANKF